MTAPEALAEPGGARAALRGLTGLLRLGALVWLSLLSGLLFWANAPVLWGWQPRLVLSGSMQPALRPGDVVLTSPVADARTLPLGRVVAVASRTLPTGSYLHRIVGHDGQGHITTKGDANWNEDFPSVGPDQVLGQAVAVIPRVGSPVVWARSREVVPLALAVGGTAAALVLVGLPADPRPARRRSDLDADTGPTPAGGPAGPAIAPPIPVVAAAPAPAASPASARIPLAAAPAVPDVAGADRSPAPATSRRPDAATGTGPLDLVARMAALSDANVAYERGCAALAEGRVPVADALLRRALAGYRQLGVDRGEANTCFALATAAEIEGDTAAAERLCLQALDRYRQAGCALGQARCLCQLASLAERAGRADQAATHLNRTLAVLAGPGDPSADDPSAAALTAHCTREILRLMTGPARTAAAARSAAATATGRGLGDAGPRSGAEEDLCLAGR